MSGNENNLAPTTPEERAEWKDRSGRTLGLAAKNDDAPTIDICLFFLRLIADVERLTQERDAAEHDCRIAMDIADTAREEMRERCKQACKAEARKYQQQATEFYSEGEIRTAAISECCHRTARDLADAIASLPLDPKASNP